MTDSPRTGNPGTGAPPVPLPYRRDYPKRPFDPVPELLRLREEPLLTRQLAPNGEPVWLVARHAEARKVLADRRFSTALTPRTLIRPKTTGAAAIASPARQPGSFLGYDPPEHTRLRRMVASAFSARRMRLLEDRVAEIVAERVEALAAAGPDTDLVTSFALPIPSLVICEMIGVPEDERADFQRRAHHAFDQTLEQSELISTFTPMWEYTASLVARQRKDPDDTILGGLVREHGGELSDTELTGITNLLLLAGHDTTASMLGLGALLLLRDPQAREVLLRDDPENTARIVEEMLRYFSVAQTGLVRTATEDVELGGRLVRAGEHVMLSLATANRDPGVYPVPDRFDSHREAEPHLAFGHGIHFCLGAPLARTEMRTAFPALLRRLPGLRLAIPFEEVPFRSFATVYGVTALPVTW
ncbi:cytochrome P450 [Streptomyces phaeochromogenes]|nr:cytochrome P450 [Streptomyces phaeochromogenes]